ncbi:MAG: diguanylate cyclase [Veillonellaceae bacterium]|nr:diguanylate cyclase [Veillonellaceae bacterium]
MFSRKVNVVIASASAQLSAILTAAPTTGDLQVSISSTDRLTQIDPRACDLLIHDLGQPAAETLSRLFPQALLVLCLEGTELDQLTEPARQTLADIWPKPFEPELIRFRFRKLLNQLILSRKYALGKNYLDTMINSVPDLIWFKRLDGIHVKVNDAFCATVHKDRQDVEGHDHYHIWSIPKEVYENSDYVCLDTDSVVIASRQPGVFDETVAGQQGLRQLKTYKSPLFDERGELIGTVGVAQDVTEFRNTDAKLELILRTMPFAVMVTDADEQVISVNPKFEEYFHVVQEELVGRPFPIREAFATTAANPPNLLYYEPDRELGLSHNRSELILEIHTEPIYDFFANFVGTLHIFRDVTTERGFQAQLKKIAYTDQLTGLCTRRFLYENIDSATTTDGISLLYIDLDNFKLINDTFGHHFGDKILKKIGKLLQTLCPDDICVRMGGDEFLIVILGPTTIGRLIAKANSIIETIKEHFPGSATLQPLSVSIGIATVSGDSKVQLEDLLRKSDIALYRAKNCGKQQCVVYTLDLEDEPAKNP